MGTQHGESVGPETIAGLHFLATLTGDNEARERYGRLAHAAGHDDDAAAVLEAAFELAVRRRFKPDCDVREITAFVSGMRTRIPAGAAVTAGLLESEALIRSALGEEFVNVDGIKRNAKLGIWLLVLGFIVRGELKLDAGQIGQLLRDAEQMAFKQGWNPPVP
jgi:hypothetical protein